MFNDTIPLIAQMSAFNFGDQFALVFTKVLDVLQRGADEYELGIETVRARHRS